MIRDITIGQYYPTDSVIHKLDPRVKLMGTLLLIIGIFLAATPWQYGLIALLVILLIASSKIPFRFIVKGLKPILFLIIFATIMNILFTRTGDILFHYGIITISNDGIRLAIEMIVRLVLLILGTSLLTFTTTPTQLTDGLEKAFRPFTRFGFPAHELAMMMTIALRFIPTLMEETDKIMKAQMARGADFESGNVFQRAKALVPILVPLFINSFNRATELAYAMEARGYRGGEGRTKLNPLVYQRRDYLGYGVLMLSLFILIGLRYV